MEAVLVLVMWLKLLVSIEHLIVGVSFIMSSGAGADFVMMGGMLAGHDQSGENSILLVVENLILNPNAWYISTNIVMCRYPNACVH